jgi:F-type H+-transporting ATPase subunit gamma
MSAKLIKTRIRTAKNISQIAKAMEMVAASKMRRSQEQATAGRPYADELLRILGRLVRRVDSSLHPLLSEGKLEAPVGLIMISTDKGLCGGLNTSLFSEMEKWVLSSKDLKKEGVRVIAVGKKGRDYCWSRKYKLLAEFMELPDYPTMEETRPLARLVIDGFVNGELSAVYAVFPDFVSTLVQKPVVRQLLPIGEIGRIREIGGEDVGEQIQEGEYLFEPDPGTVIDWLLPYYVENQLYHLLLEARASEHSARMVAMKNARENATDIVSDLTLEYNRLRQAKITGELLDTISAKKALAGS